MNRIIDYAANVQAIIDSGHKPDGSPIGDLETLEKSLELSLAEVFAWQNAKSVAQMKGIITLDEAMTIYTAIGESGGWAADTSLAMKVTITNLMGQLLPIAR